MRRRLSSNAIAPSAVRQAAAAMVTPDVGPVAGKPLETVVVGAVDLGRTAEVVVVVRAMVVVGDGAGVVVVVVVVSGGHETAVVSVANAPAVSGTVNWVYRSWMFTLSTRPAVLQSVGSFGIVTWNDPAHGVFGASVDPALMTVPPATVQLMFTTVPPGDGLVSVSAVTSAGLSPVFETMNWQVMVWPIVATSAGQFLNACAPVPGSGT
jgi:hypothetical protein